MGPSTVAPFAGLLADQRQARVITSVHPGFGGTDRPAWLTDVPTLARAYARLLDELHAPAKFAVDPAALPEAARAVMAANLAALEVYSGPQAMADPALREHLAKVTHPALVVWGESDQVVDAEYGRAYAAAIPGARFELLHCTGHMSQMETPEQLLTVVRDFADAHATNRPNR
ncbi:alpha/beta fold hydrolase [Streptomyces sp. 2323.1]|uniref:alpha/beta fold hydrolase n=1 Tax=Streptomyces sp. 2323.1 TaxID=1938841 RepID=UPI001E3A2EF6|nr:alpha/beta hydrolase [Streptomyces sp. 2323.1]